MLSRMTAVGLVAAFAFACDAQPAGPDHPAAGSTAAPHAVASVAQAGNGTIISFGAMYGVDEALVNHRQIRDVLGDELPWDVGSARGSLSMNGHLSLHVRGIVFANDPEVPPELRGKNDESTFRALVSCLVPSEDKVSTVNITTAGFPATTTGNSDIETNIQLPSDCIAPIVFVLSGSEDKWFAVNGAEID